MPASADPGYLNVNDVVFTPATREHVWTCTGLAGGTGSGKTYTAMRLATGIVEELVGPDGRFAVIDTENDRAKHYADFFRFDHFNLRPPFRPLRYLAAIEAAAKAGYKCAVVDSFSHEQEGEGGLNEFHDEEVERLAKLWNVRDKSTVNIAAWIEPKTQHRKMVQRMLQLQLHLILCFRADDKIEIGKDAQGRTEIRAKQSPVGYEGWIPIAEKRLPYELTVSFMLLAQKPGVPNPIKLQEQHRALFPPDVAITEASGRELAKWARGGPVDWIARIRSTWNNADLQNIAAQLKNARLDEATLKAARAAWTDQYNTVRARQSGGQS